MTRMTGGTAWWQVALCVLVWGTPSCVLGGQTGEASERPAYACDRGPLAYDKVSSWGYSAAQMVAELGGPRTATADARDGLFWRSLGVNPAPEGPVPVALSVQYAKGRVLEDRCARVLIVEVVVALEIGGDLYEQTATGTLTGSESSAELSVDFPVALRDASDAPAVLRLAASLGPSTLAGRLMTDGRTTQLDSTGISSDGGS